MKKTAEVGMSRMRTASAFRALSRTCSEEGTSQSRPDAARYGRRTHLVTALLDQEPERLENCRAALVVGDRSSLARPSHRSGDEGAGELGDAGRVSVLLRTPDEEAEERVERRRASGFALRGGRRRGRAGERRVVAALRLVYVAQDASRRRLELLRVEPSAGARAIDLHRVRLLALALAARPPNRRVLTPARRARPQVLGVAPLGSVDRGAHDLRAPLARPDDAHEVGEERLERAQVRLDDLLLRCRRRRGGNEGEDVGERERDGVVGVGGEEGRDGVEGGCESGSESAATLLEVL